MIKDLKDRATKMYDIQNDWIGQRFQKEMDRYHLKNLQHIYLNCDSSNSNKD